MSSVSRFIKQVPSGNNFYSASGLSAANVYEFVPSSGNVVGNYPPGYVQLAAGMVAPANAMVRDMGKTIYAGIGSSASSFGWFRQVQFISPAPITAAQGFIGGSSGSTFGVVGGAANPDVYTNFAVFYLPINVNGVLAPANQAASAGILGGHL